MTKQEKLNQKIDDFFMKKPDSSTLAKMNIFKKYFGIYFNLISSIKNNQANHAENKKIKYIDLFSGPGIFSFDGETIKSTPQEIIENIIDKGYENISFYFNDKNLNHINYLKNNLDLLQKNKNKYLDIHYINDDAKNINLSKIIDKDDIVISLVDSYSYLCLDVETIHKLTDNYYSDTVCYFRVANILTHIGNSNEANNHIAILGSKENYKTLIDMKKNNQDERINYLLKSWIDNINQNIIKRYFLPIFIKFSDRNSKIESVVFIISKNKLGLNRVKSMITDVEVDSGKYYYYLGANINMLKLFDDDIDIIKEHIDTNVYIDVKELQSKIDESFIKKYGYISAYSDAFIKSKLKLLEEENKLDFIYFGNKKRREFTYSDKTKFRLIKGDRSE